MSSELEALCSFVFAGETAVHVACCRGLLNMVVVLLKHGGDPMVTDGAGRVAIHCAAIAGSPYDAGNTSFSLFI